MSENEKDKEIISDIVRNIDSEGDYQTHTSKNQDAQQDSYDEESSLGDVKETGFIKKLINKIKNKKGNLPLTTKQLLIKRGNQNLAERKILLIILALLLGIQLFFMNGVVLLIILYSVFEWDKFRSLDATILHNILNFTKYYVTAVLVELLGGIIYIVHRVFTNDD